ncbi:MAG TPA: EamA family transporter [Candidatus Limnocylindrales bacterium]|nr:EamA family transporter [Candidatus Limnocylindrales bacterium]
MDHSHKPTTDDVSSRDGRVWLGLLTLYVVWGSTYLGIAIAVGSIPPFLMAATRFLLAGLILLTWSVARDGRSFVIPTRREVRDSAIVGALLLGGGMGFVAFAEQTVPSGIAALLIATMPIWVAVLGGIFLGERLPRLAVLGIVVGFVGVAVLVAPSIVGGTGALDPVGLVFCLLSPLAWATGSLFASHRATLPPRPLVATGLQMVLGGLVLSVMAIGTGEVATFDLATVTRDSFLAFLYLTVVGSLIAFTVFGYMLRVAPLPLVTTYAYVNPVVAVILGAIILGEAIDPRTVLAGTIIVIAVALIVTARGRMRAPREEAAATDEIEESAVTTPRRTTARAPTP